MCSRWTTTASPTSSPWPKRDTWAPRAEGYANDDHVYRVVIEAADDGRGVLTVTTKVDGEVRSSVTAGRTTTATESR